MGIQGIAGFVAFFASSMVLSLGMYLKMEANPKPYFKTGSDVWTEGIGQALMVCRHRGDAWHILLRALIARIPATVSVPIFTVRLPAQSYVMFWTLFFDIVHIY